MKKLLLAVALLIAVTTTWAQAPQALNYQAVVRDASGNSVANNTPVQLRFTIRDGSPTGTSVYTETVSTTANSFGLVTTTIGGTANLSTVNWGNGAKYLQVEANVNNTSFVDMGTSQLNSVPYALYAANSAPGATGPAGPTGPQGDPGAPGVDGAVGATGPAGAVGPTGPQGATGADGAQGAQGPVGSTGPQGAQGAQGPQGVQGVAGPTGPAGANGATGATGPQGPQGPQGAQGPAGPAGPQGAQGANGATGATGAAGPQGAQGVQGVAGPTGPAGANGATGATGATGPGGVTGTTGYHPKFLSQNTLGNSIMQENTNGNIGVNISPLVQYRMYVYNQQLTANGDGQTTLFGYRTRDSQNDGTGYAQSVANDATRGFNFWGDVYTFGVGGWNYNDYTRCGGVIGAEVSGTYWGSLGYRSSGLLNYGVYGSSAYASGGGYLPTVAVNGVGGGFFGNMIGSVSRGAVVGQLNTGELFATYNIGDVYTSGRQIEMVTAGEQKVAAFTTTSTEAVVYKKGNAQLVNGEAYIKFEANFSALLGESPEVTVTPKGDCNGVYIASVDKNGFTVKESKGGNSNVVISWIAAGNRVDAAKEIPALVKDNTFDSNLLKSMYDDSNRESAGQGMWWDGQTLRFGTPPAELSVVKRPDGDRNK